MAFSPDRVNANFRYSSLNPGRREIRLFTFDGRDELNNLHGRLETIELNRKTKYIALSYEWGDDVPTQRIVVNDHFFCVRRNLYNFLEHAASRHQRKHAFFIDALCIDQASLAERSNQVRLMPNIYSQASEVRAWLGPLPAWWTSNPQLSDLRTTVTKREWGNFMYFLLNHRHPKDPLRFTITQMTEWAKASGLDNLTIIAARVAAQRPFWQRLWIVQELLLADSLTLYLGDRTLDPKTVLRVSRAMSGYFDAVSETSKSMTPAALLGSRTDALNDGLRFQDAAVILTRKYTNGPEPAALPLHELLDAFQMQRCREPRDHVFGLLGLSSSALQPDYGISLPQLYLYAVIEAHVHIQQDVSITPIGAGFKAAAPSMAAFGWNISDVTIHLLTKRAIERDTEGPYALWIALWTMSTTLNQRSWPRAYRWSLEAVQLLLLVVLPIGWWKSIYVRTGKNTPMIYAYGPPQCAYGAHAALLAIWRLLDWELAAPDGQVRTYSGWCAEIDRIAVLVRNRKPLVPLSASEKSTCYPSDHGRSRHLQSQLIAIFGAAAPPIAWLAGWAGTLLLFYTLYSGTIELLRPLLWERAFTLIPEWFPVWKASIASYVMFRIASMRGDFPAQL